MVLESLNKRFGGNDFHQLEGEYGNFVGFNVLFNHSCELDDLISIFLLFVLNLPCNFKRFVLLAENEILDFL
jgi:hypothetical protein